MISLCFALVGCVQKSGETRFRGDKNIRPARVALTGIIAKSKVSGEYALADVAATSVGYQSLETILDPLVNKLTNIETTQIARLCVLDHDGTKQWQEYTVFLGPPFGVNAPAKGSIQPGSSVATVVYGWIYLTGRQPIAASERVRAGAVGSTLLVQVDSADEKIPHRVFLLDNGSRPAFAESLIDPSEKIENWDKDETYIEVDHNGKFSDIKEISTAPAEIRDFVDKVLKVVDVGS